MRASLTLVEFVPPGPYPAGGVRTGAGPFHCYRTVAALPPRCHRRRRLRRGHRVGPRCSVPPERKAGHFMTEPTRRMGRLAAGSLLAAIALLIGPWPSASATVRSVAHGVPAAVTAAVPDRAAAGDDVIGGVRVADVVVALADNHVAVIGSAADEAQLAQVVSDARAKNLKLSVVSLKARLTQSDATLMAAEVRTQVGGTVLVLTPTSGGLDSSELSGTQQKTARAAAAAGG